MALEKSNTRKNRIANGVTSKRGQISVGIGDSPQRGIRLRSLLHGNSDAISALAWSPDGAYLAAVTVRGNLVIWDTLSESCVQNLPATHAISEDENELQGPRPRFNTLAWSKDGNSLAASFKYALHIWDTNTWIRTAVITYHDDIRSIAWSPNSKIIATSLRETVHILDLQSNAPLEILTGLKTAVPDVTWSPTGTRLVASTAWKIVMWETESWTVLGECITNNTLPNQSKHTTGFYQVLWSNDESTLMAGSTLGTIHLWDTSSFREILVVEGHNEEVHSITVSYDQKILASKSRDNTVRLWSTGTWAEIGNIPENSDSYVVLSIAFHPIYPILASYDPAGTGIRLWDVDHDALLNSDSVHQAVRYTTSKLVLVGDSGVGKTGLGWRLAHGEFKEHSSTHGQQFWVITEFGVTREDGSQGEAVLWDLAGQHLYRSVHSIFLENIDAALILFDPGNRLDPLKGAQFWIEQLKGNARLPPCVLVGARADRGTPSITEDELSQFCQRVGIVGGYVSTSAKTDFGLQELVTKVSNLIPWETKSATITTLTFKKIKDYILELKEQPGRANVLISPDDLGRQLRANSKEWNFSEDDMMTAIRHLENHGYITILHSSSGKVYLLLAPDLLVSLASSIVLLADSNVRELGAINETQLLQGKYPLTELVGLDKTEAQVLLDGAILKFMQHNMCFRQSLSIDVLLVFPGLIKQKRPLGDDLVSEDDVTYIVRGKVENIYAMLVVSLGYTSSFTRINQWQNQAQYEMMPGEICGFRMISEREGEIEFVIYYTNRMTQAGRDSFQKLFEEFLYQRDAEILVYPTVYCKNEHRIERTTIINRLRDEKNFAYCAECGDRVELADPHISVVGIDSSPWLKAEEAIARLRTTYEYHLSQVKSYRIANATPKCFISHLDDSGQFIHKLSKDLRDAGVYLILDVEPIGSQDHIVILDTPNYQNMWQNDLFTAIPHAATIRDRIKSRSRKIHALRLGQTQNQAISWHDIDHCNEGLFDDESHYIIGLFNIILTLYNIPMNNQSFAPRRRSLHEQWETSFAGTAGNCLSTSELKPMSATANSAPLTVDVVILTVLPEEYQNVCETVDDLRPSTVVSSLFCKLSVYPGSLIIR